MKFPSSEPSLSGNSAFDFDHSRGAEIGPSEFFFAGPDNFDRTICSARQAGGFESRVGGVLSAVGRSGIRNDDADAIFGNVQRRRQFFLHAEGTLRASPDGELVVFPFGDGGAWFEWSVSNVGDGVSLLEALRCRS